MMRHFVLAGLLILAGCMDDYSPNSARQGRNPGASGICAGDDCFGLHQYEPPSKCAQCGVGELPTVHHFCKGCAARLARCAHCGRKLSGKPAERKEAPPPPAPAPPPPRRAPDPSAICPEHDCVGMHEFQPPSTCAACDVGGLPTFHHYCPACALKLDRCTHCGRKKPAKPVERKEAPPPPAAETPPPPAEKKEPPPPEPKAGKPRPDEILAVEPVDLSEPARKSHSLIVFAAEREKAKGALATHRTHKEADIAKLPAPRVGHEPGLFLVWGHFPEPNITELNVKAVFDGKSGTIRVTLPPFPSRPRKDGGIGMDWVVDKDKSWPFVAFRVKLGTLPAGTYSFEVMEVERLRKDPRILSSGKFDLKKD